jgi:hypothetical protein
MLGRKQTLRSAIAACDRARQRREIDAIATQHARTIASLEAFIMSVQQPELREALYRAREAGHELQQQLATARTITTANQQLSGQASETAPSMPKQEQ